jgi:hypothetical protein
VSFTKKEYLAVGGFDLTLGRSEDRELGVRLEKAGARLAFAKEAVTVHRTDHTDREVWLRRAFQYGVFDLRISRLHPELEIADPWRFLFRVNLVSRPLMMLSALTPRVGGLMARAGMRALEGVDGLGFEQLAISGTTFCYGLEYFRGMREESGSATGALRGLWQYLLKRSRLEDSSP